MEIIEILENKKKYLPLLLLADEEEKMIHRYLNKGTMFVLEDKGRAKAVCIVTNEGDNILEIKNIAVNQKDQKQGYGRQLIGFIHSKFQEQYKVLQVGTGDSPLTVPFYEKCGFKKSHIIKDFFIEHYSTPIYEGGQQLVDKVYLRKNI